MTRSEVDSRGVGSHNDLRALRIAEAACENNEIGSSFRPPLF
jgi:hypothetical protein